MIWLSCSQFDKRCMGISGVKWDQLWPVIILKIPQGIRLELLSPAIWLLGKSWRSLPPHWFLGVECIHLWVQQPCKFSGTKESVYIRKGLNSHRIGLLHQHGRRFIVLEHQYGCHDVMCICSTLSCLQWLSGDLNYYFGNVLPSILYLDMGNFRLLELINKAFLSLQIV